MNRKLIFIFITFLLCTWKGLSWSDEPSFVVGIIDGPIDVHHPQLKGFFLAEHLKQLPFHEFDSQKENDLWQLNSQNLEEEYHQICTSPHYDLLQKLQSQGANFRLYLKNFRQLFLSNSFSKLWEKNLKFNHGTHVAGLVCGLYDEKARSMAIEGSLSEKQDFEIIPLPGLSGMTFEGLTGDSGHQSTPTTNPASKDILDALISKLEAGLTPKQESYLKDLNQVIKLTKMKVVNISLYLHYEAVAQYYESVIGQSLVNKNKDKFKKMVDLTFKNMKEVFNQVITENPNTLFIFSAGNKGINIDEISPEKFPYFDSGQENVLIVGATDDSGHLASFSNHGKAIDIAAPGIAIQSCQVKGGFIPMSGTSMAAPIVTHKVIELWKKHPEFTSQEIRSLLLQENPPLQHLQKQKKSGVFIKRE